MKWCFKGGQWKDNQETLGAVSTHRFTVPAGKRWYVQSVYAEIDASASMLIDVHNAGNFMLWEMFFAAASTNDVSLGPGPLIANKSHPMRSFYLSAGDYILLTWGAQQTTPEVACTVFEVNEP